jgi:hypothetical protein
MNDCSAFILLLEKEQPIYASFMIEYFKTQL